MTTMAIALIVAIGVAITLYSVTLREVIKKGYSGKRIARLLLPLGLIFIVYLSYHVFEIQPADWAQIMLMLGLVSVTGVYAYFTFKMAEEMREQRYSESLPLLAPTIPPPLSGLAPNEIPYESLQSGVGIKVIWCNVGKGRGY